MEGKEMEKALQDLAKALEDNEAVQTIKITITLKKPKPSKANLESR